MGKKEKSKPLTTKQIKRKVTKAVNKAIDLAIDDTGLDPQNYGMLEERIRWYLDVDKFDLGFEVDIEFDRENFLVGVQEIRQIFLVDE